MAVGTSSRDPSRNKIYNTLNMSYLKGVSGPTLSVGEGEVALR